MKSIAVTLLCCAAATGAWAAPARIAKDGMLEVNGQRTFVLGLYENPEDARLDEVAAAGFNLVHASADTAALDRLWAKGIYSWLNTGATIDLGSDTESKRAKLESMSTEFSKHPGFLVWEVPDEALWNTWYAATQWRRGAEPREQDTQIAQVQDAGLAAELRTMREEAEAAYGRGEPKAGEQLADEIWRKLGKEPPHPDLNLSNAPERQNRLAEGMVQGYQFLKELDPNHPIWMNHAPRNSIEQLALFNRGADVVGCDIYPVPRSTDNGHSDLSDQFLSCVGGYTRRMQEAAPAKPVWMVLQGFGWADIRERPDADARDRLRQPNPNESRFMAYEAIVNGARGILYWGTAYVDKEEPFWTELLSLVTELSAQQPVWSAPDAALDVKITLAQTWGSLDRGVRVLPKQVGSRVYLLVVNEWLDPLVYTLHGLGSLDGVRYRDPTTGQESIVQRGTLTLPIRGFGVHVLEPLEP